MTSYKLKPEHFSLHHPKPYPSQSQFLNHPSFSLLQDQSSTSHKAIINEINLKNQALKGHDLPKQPNSNHPNYLTFCQQYTQMLCQKYASKEVAKDTPHNRNQENCQPKTFTQEIQEKVSLNLIAYKRFFQNAEFQFEKDYEQLILRLKHLSRMLYARNSAFAEKDQQVDEDLLVMDLFLTEVNMKIHQSTMKLPTHYVTPFSMFAQDLIKRKTPERARRQKNKRENSMKYYQQDYIKGESEQKQRQRKEEKTRLFIVSPGSPQMLWSFNQHHNKAKQHKTYQESIDNQNGMFVSFNQQTSNNFPHQIMVNKKYNLKSQSNLQGSQAMGDTLKYSESQMMGNEMLNIELDGRSRELQSSVQDREMNVNGAPFSPVQPYRLHKLYNQANINRLNHGHSQNTHKTDDLETQIFLERENQAFKQTLASVQNQFQALIAPLTSTCQKLALALTQTLTDVSQIMAQSQVLLKQEKLSTSQDWEDVLKLISGEIQQLEEGLMMEKEENNLKDRKFLQNLQIVQNQLIEMIFEEKESRKAEEGVLTQVLSNLVDSLENGYG